MNGADWSDRYPLIAAEASRLKGSAILDAEVVCADKDGVPDFGLLHSRCFDHLAVACAFDLLMLDGDDMRRKPFAERKAALGKLLFRSRDGIQYVEHAEGHGDRMYGAVCDLGLEGIVSKRAECALPIRSIKELDQGQEPEGAGCHPGDGWKFLVELRRGSNGYLRETEVFNVIQVSFFGLAVLVSASMKAHVSVWAAKRARDGNLTSCYVPAANGSPMHF